MGMFKKSLTIRIVTIFISMTFLCSNLAYSSDVSYLRVPMKIEKGRTGELLDEIVTEGGNAISEDRTTQSIQRLITMDILEIPPMQELGEKSHKLLKMAHAGLNVLRFFIIVGDGSGEITITDELKALFDSLRKPLIVRSSHRDEGTAYSFSGVFDSYGGIVCIEPTATEIIDPSQEGFWVGGPKPESLKSAYKLIMEGAADGYRVQKYLEAHRITDFDPKQMNLVVMEEVDIDIFGMFITSNQNNPDEVLIHYQIRDKDADKAPSEFDRFSISNRETGGVITYNKKTHGLEENGLNEQTQDILVQFGKTAAQIESLYGVQQIELGASAGKVYVFQSRDINLGDPEDTPRLAHYITLCEDLDAIGYGYYYLPVLVIDSLDEANPAYKETKEYRELISAYRELISAYIATPGQMEEKRRLNNALDNLREAERDKYKAILLTFQREHPEYILMIKDAGDIMLEKKGLFPFPQRSYDFLNSLASKAKVVIRGRNQTAIRHDDWNNVELGVITVIPQEVTEFARLFVHTRQAKDDIDLGDELGGWKRGNKTIQYPKRIATGDYLNVLSNIDGVFIWYGKPMVSNLSETVTSQKNTQEAAETGI